MSSPRFADRNVQDCLGWKQRVELEEKTAQVTDNGRLLSYRGHGPYVQDKYLMGGAVDVIRRLKQTQQQLQEHDDDNNHMVLHTGSSLVSSRSTFTAPSARGASAAHRNGGGGGSQGSSRVSAGAMERMQRRMATMEAEILKEREDTQRIHGDLAEIKALLMVQTQQRQSSSKTKLSRPPRALPKVASGRRN